MASTFPQKQSETSQSANKKMIHLHALLHRRTWYYNALFFEDAFHFQYNFPFKLKYFFHKTFKHPQKSNPRKVTENKKTQRKSINFSDG